MYSWCATRNPESDSTHYLADLRSVTTESRNDSPCMTATPWSRVNWNIYDENSTFACFGAICTQFSVTWPHCGTVHDFLAVLTDRACRHEWDFSQRDGSDSTCGRRVHTVQTKHQSKHQRVLPAYMWPSIRARAIKGFNKCVWILFTLEGMIQKREGIWHVFRMALHNSGIGVWRHDNSPWRCHVSIRQCPSLCNAILNTCPCLLAIRYRGWKIVHYLVPQWGIVDR